MSAQPATAAQSQRAPDEERARWRRRDHANIEAMQNLVIAESAHRAALAYASAHPADEDTPGLELPAHARHLISALQGAHGGGAVAFAEFTRDYLTIGRQLQFTGTHAAVRARVRRRIDDLLAWQQLVGYELISVVKGGEIVGHQPDGTPIRKGSTFIDNLLPHADDGVQRARSSELWRGNVNKRLKAHPGNALAAQVASVLHALPKVAPPAPDGAKDTTPLALDKYAQQREEKLLDLLEEVAERIEKRGGEGWEFVDRFAMLAARLANSMRTTEAARRDDAALSIFDIDAAPPDEAESTSLYHKNVTQGTPEVPSTQQDSAPQIRTIADLAAASMLQAALFWAGQGVPVFPLYGVADGVCDCHAGSECKSAGKHPRTRTGLKEATTDARQIKFWWTRWPHANIGGATGGGMRLLVVDSDPKNGGATSLYDLVEAYGDEWLDTLHVKTGGNGDHLWFNYPADVELRNTAGKLAPGIDTRAEGGYVCLAPSMHASGRRYEVTTATPTAPAPAWLIELLTRTPEQVPAQLIEFQAHRERGAGGHIIAEGERNRRVFEIGCAIWGKGEATDAPDLHLQLLEVNSRRCMPPLDGGEVAAIAASISARYVRGTSNAKRSAELNGAAEQVGGQ